ncbi:DUF3817 domain-containing protein [Nocardioides nematodiphilus]|uniref:DUF3817 domain-containing protein n=1 Tax=Nocardioides nematodiphilus TaxID=2849669 RepID=UPI001CD9AE49|nr:DUF3817 domain-containing protein [Nocardioides nematodiphilus]MCA1982907.1 DUF3817 domain-containing protein [Nocardioides nematodiphilus]
MSNDVITSEASASAEQSGAHRGIALAFRTTALIEALTWVGLLIGMLFKYVISDNAIGVHVFGPIHGAAFTAYVISTSLAARTFGWSFKLWIVGLIASVPPLATLLFERYVVRRDRLSA